MKLITLNIWGGHVKEPLLAFFRAHTDIDVFCLQEVYHRASKKVSTDDRAIYLDILDEINQILPDHKAYFTPSLNGSYGIAILVRSPLRVVDDQVHELSIYENPEYSGAGPAHSRKLQWVIVADDQGREYVIVNVHGLWNGKGKTDTPDRLAQSKRIQTLLGSFQKPVVMVGDFNLRLDTESLAMVAKNMKNWIELHHVTCTRTELYDKEEGYADYIFTSPELGVRGFKVLPDVVSDHCPLWIEFQ